MAPIVINNWIIRVFEISHDFTFTKNTVLVYRSCC